MKKPANPFYAEKFGVYKVNILNKAPQQVCSNEHWAKNEENVGKNNHLTKTC